MRTSSGNIQFRFWAPTFAKRVALQSTVLPKRRTMQYSQETKDFESRRNVKVFGTFASEVLRVYLVCGGG
jgi:hypothetical protein